MDKQPHLRQLPKPCPESHASTAKPATTMDEAIRRLNNSLGLMYSISPLHSFNGCITYVCKIWENEYLLYGGMASDKKPNDLKGLEEAVLEAYQKWRTQTDFVLTEAGKVAIAEHLLGICKCESDNETWDGPLHTWKPVPICKSVSDLMFLDTVAHQYYDKEKKEDKPKKEAKAK